MESCLSFLLYETFSFYVLFPKTMFNAKQYNLFFSVHVSQKKESQWWSYSCTICTNFWKFLTPHFHVWNWFITRLKILDRAQPMGNFTKNLSWTVPYSRRGFSEIFTIDECISLWMTDSTAIKFSASVNVAYAQTRFQQTKQSWWDMYWYMQYYTYMIYWCMQY